MEWGLPPECRVLVLRGSFLDDTYFQLPVYFHGHLYFTKEGMVGRTSDDDDDGIARTKQPKESACVYIITLKLPGGTNASKAQTARSGTEQLQNLT